MSVHFLVVTSFLLTSTGSMLGQSRAAAQESTPEVVPLSKQAGVTDSARSALAKRVDILLQGTLSSLSGRFFSLGGVAATTDKPAIREKVLTPVYYTGYHPTMEELLDQIQRQTKSTATYNAERNTWVFDFPSTPLPFTLTMAPGWTSTDKGMSLACRPPVAPYALDIFVLGKHSAQPGEKIEDILQKAQEHTAMTFIGKIDPKVKLADMKKEKIAGLDALYCETVAPSSGMKWRQWVFTASNRVYAIASALRPEQENLLLPHIHQMLRTISFRE
ncbi:MAG: hypothetical protein ACAI35_21755 [Candidatus Methylacidiphilales bacterium]